MTSSRRLEFADQARRDLRSILRYTLKTWGQRRRDAYSDRLAKAMHELLTFPDLGRSREDVAPGLRCHPIREHVIYYRADDEVVRIVRILHVRMNAVVHLEDDKAR